MSEQFDPFEPGQQHRQHQTAELQALLDVQDRLTGLEAAVQDALTSAVETAMRRVLSDAELQKGFWATGHAELWKHSKDGTANWIGSRILSWIAGVLLVAGISLAIRYGLPAPKS